MRYVLRWARIAGQVCLLGVIGAGCSAQFNYPLDVAGYNRLRYSPTLVGPVSGVTADGVTTQSVTVKVLSPETGEAVTGLKLTLGATGVGHTISQPAVTDSNGETTLQIVSTKAEDKSVYIVDPEGLDSSTAVVTFVAGPASAAFSTITATGPTPSDGVSTATVTATIRDANMNPVAGETVEFHASGSNNTPATSVGSPALCGVSDSQGHATCTLSSLSSESKTLRLLTPFDKTGGTAVFIAGAPDATNSTITGTSPVFDNGVSFSTVTVTLKDGNSNLVPGIAPTFGATGSGNISSACTISDEAGVSTCLLRSTVAEAKTLSILTPVSKAGGVVTFIPEQPSWIGTAYDFKKWGSGGLPVSGPRSGAFFRAQSITIDTIADEIYIVENSGGRINRLVKSVATFLGWMGLIKVVPSDTAGFPNCDVASVDTFTPGWCIDGEAKIEPGTASLGSLKSARGSYRTDDGFLYVADSINNRINKYEIATGTFIGWFGYVASGAAGMTGVDPLTGCELAANSAVSPGWCLGGVAGPSLGSEGGFNTPMSVFVHEVETPPKMYVADSANSRVNKYALNSDGTVSWIGSIGKVTGGGFTGAFLQTGPFDGLPNAKFSLGGMHAPQDVVVYGTNLYVSDFGSGISRINKYDISGTFHGWIGRVSGLSPSGGHTGCTAAAGVATPGWCVGGDPGIGTDDGMFDSPLGLAIDGPNELLYVVDSNNHRVQRFKISHNNTGVDLYEATFDGWFGRVLTKPTSNGSGASGCSSAAIGARTPGWCKGGTSQRGSGDGMMDDPRDVEVDPNGSLYVADAENHRIQRFDSTTGAFDGWTGMSILAKSDWNPSPLPASVVSGSGDGMLNSPRAAYEDSSGKLYVVDSLNHRVNRYDAVTGQSLGWIGAVKTIPTGGAAGCTSAAVGTLTPGWCTGGSSQEGVNEGMLKDPAGITGDSLGYIYVADTGHHRILKFNAATGQYFGWIGRVAGSSPTPTGSQLGGIYDTACKTASANVTTPFWCFGNNAISASATAGDGGMSSPTGIAQRGGFLYVADSANNRVYKFSAEFGSLIGWTGVILSSTTMGDGSTNNTGCNQTLTSGTFTPNWCKRGTTQSNVGQGTGGMSDPRGVSADDTYVYVSDAGNHRVARYRVSDGGFEGWIGRVSTNPTGQGTGNPISCAVGANNPTPGWCTGGTVISGTTGNGSMQGPQGVTVDDLGNLFVADTANHRVLKFVTATGAFVGWQGAVGASVPTGPGVACTGTATGSATPEWCTGGTSASGGLDRMLNGPRSAFVRPNGSYLYIPDFANHRVMRFPD